MSRGFFEKITLAQRKMLGKQRFWMKRDIIANFLYSFLGSLHFSEIIFGLIENYSNGSNVLENNNIAS